MKAIKIILTIVVVAIIGFFVAMWVISMTDPSDASLPENQYTKEVQRKIDSLKTLPENKFCQNYYKNVQSSIDEFYKNDFLGLTSYKDGNIWKEKKDETNNKEWKEILSKNLYSAYASKFVDQAMYVFKGSLWRDADLKFIRTEMSNLRKSTYLNTGGVVDSFNEINKILAKYDEINRFVNECKGFVFSNNDIRVASDVSGKVKKSKTFLDNNLDNKYVKNCIRLKEDLKAIPSILFNKHVKYLQQKINDNGKRYDEFNFQSEYSTEIYTPLKKEVDALDNSVYGISNSAFNTGYNSVNNLLSSYNHDAVRFFRNK